MILGIGTRWSDFTTASRSLFAEDARFINLNVASVDAFKHAGLPLVGDARSGLEALRGALEGHTADPDHTERASRLAAEWDATVEQAYTLGHAPAARAERGARRRQPRLRPARRRRVRGGLDARRPAQAVAHARPEGLPRRVRLLDAWATRSPAASASSSPRPTATST